MTHPVYYRVTPLEPLIARDSRPFGDGGRAGSLEWLTPSVIAGALRTFLWNIDEKMQDTELLKRIEVSGGFPVYKNTIYFPRPADILMGKVAAAQKNGESRIYQIRPIELTHGHIYELPKADKGFLPSLAKGALDERFKPDSMNSWWQSSLLEGWLKDNGQVKLKPEDFKEPGTLSPASKDIRVHVSIDPETLTAAEGNLFSTTGLDLIHRLHTEDSSEYKPAEPVQLSIRVDYEADGLSAEEIAALPDTFILPLGGDHRAARFEKMDDAKYWTAFKDINICLGKNGTLLLRMVLATPAIFANGWLPGWLGDDLCNKFPGTEIKLKLVSAIVNRWDPVSGWNYEKGKNVPKPLRRMAPAGSVYFFEVVEDPKHQLCKGHEDKGAFDFRELWLRSCSDDDQDKRDGFGLTLWGTWFESRDDEKENKNNE